MQRMKKILYNILKTNSNLLHYTERPTLYALCNNPHKNIQVIITAATLYIHESTDNIGTLITLSVGASYCSDLIVTWCNTY